MLVTNARNLSAISNRTLQLSFKGYQQDMKVVNRDPWECKQTPCLALCFFQANPFILSLLCN